MIIEEALYKRLSNTSGSTGVIAIVSSSNPRIYPQTIPQSAWLPAITYSKISGVRETAFQYDPGIVTSRIQINSWSTSYLQAKILADAVYQNLRDFSGLMGGTSGVQVDFIAYENESDEFYNDVDVHQVIQDFFIGYHE